MVWPAASVWFSGHITQETHGVFVQMVQKAWDVDTRRHSGKRLNCADVQINSVVGSYPPGALAVPRRQMYSADTGAPLVVTARVCLATEPYSTTPGMDEWCHKSCLSYPPHCPADKCQCLSHCEAVGRLAGEEGTDVFCHRNCLR